VRRASVVAMALATGGALVVATTSRTTPGITFSNTLTRARDGRVITSTLVPKASWRGGQTWTITIRHDAAPVESLTFRTPGMAKYAFADSVWAPFPRCVPYRVTVVPDTALTATGRALARRDSLTASRSLCRPFTRAEAAFADSFPASGWRITWCGGWARRLSMAALDSLLMDRLRAARTADDSSRASREVRAARARPDSVPLPPGAWGQRDTLVAEVGFVYPVAVLGKNRYTGTVRSIEDTPPCAAERAAYEASSEGRAP
jgi:hypothetical protein